MSDEKREAESLRAEPPRVPLVSVCICTFHRPHLLPALFDALATRERVPGPVEIVVVDNDRAGSATPAIAAAREAHPSLRIRSFIEPEQNIALARNRAVGKARGRFIAFIDDDEVPDPAWLASLLATAEATGADGVFGPVVPRLPVDVQPWIERGGFFDRPRHPTGAPVPTDELRTGNALLRRELLAGPQPVQPVRLTVLRSVPADGADDEPADTGRRESPFDPAYGLSGGEDSTLFGSLAATGARFVWCDDAIVRETVPPERANLAYLLRRSFGGGHGYARLRLVREGASAVPSLLLRGGASVGCAALMSLATLPLGLHHSVKWTRIGAAGIGKLLGITPLAFEPYRAPTTNS